ncbi:hypothetical protein BCD67_07500 [Oscillatoriales cyanobacterium USR001]|nr:hypothetical protein BCD67_07500 [Oscillatoriales cyanobacterium USR001]
MPMVKIAVLSFLTGDCQQGFQQVRLENRDDNQRLLGAFMGKLPPAPHIPELYTTWQSRYRLMGSRFRELEKKPGVITNFSSRDLEINSDALKQQLNDWLKSPDFFPVMQGLLMKVRQDEEVRVIVQTEDSHLRRLPWHLWEFYDHYLNAEVALSSPVFQQSNSPKTRNKVRILAIIGDSTGINLERDQRELEEKLPEAEIVFVREPEKEKVFEVIWDWRGWDILFFAGHSISEPDATTGKLFIKDGKSLEIGDLKLTLRKAIARGLKLAIFNSCDGLGIAKQLADLNMPQVIVMREPVPDMVAQEFLKFFLEAFARGESLYLAVREARERLESVQHEFPCATWLPVICQNPAEEPVSWRELCKKIETDEEQSSEQHYSATLRFIGDRIAGKSTYLASLVRWPNSDPSTSPVQTVTPINDDAKELFRAAKNILEQGDSLPPTYYDCCDQQDYFIQIVLKKQFPSKSFKQTIINQLITMNINCKEYMGELFNYLLDDSSSIFVEEHLQDCLIADGLLLLIDYFNSKDDEYAISLDILIRGITRLEVTPKKRRIAFIFTKCDLPELWLNRTYPRKLASTRFPQVYKRLESLQQLGSYTVDYFTTSSFGMIGTQFLEPNSIFDYNNQYFSVLKDPKYWKPFGLVSPIFWLCTGNRYHELDIT